MIVDYPFDEISFHCDKLHTLCGVLNKMDTANRWFIKEHVSFYDTLLRTYKKYEYSLTFSPINDDNACVECKIVQFPRWDEKQGVIVDRVERLSAQEMILYIEGLLAGMYRQSEHEMLLQATENTRVSDIYENKR